MKVLEFPKRPSADEEKLFHQSERQRAVELLEAWLVDARAGRVSGIGIVGETNEGDPQWGWMEGPTSAAMVAAASRLHLEMTDALFWEEVPEHEAPEPPAS